MLFVPGGNELVGLVKFQFLPLSAMYAALYAPREIAFGNNVAPISKYWHKEPSQGQKNRKLSRSCLKAQTFIVIHFLLNFLF